MWNYQANSVLMIISGYAAKFTPRFKTQCWVCYRLETLCLNEGEEEQETGEERKEELLKNKIYPWIHATNQHNFKYAMLEQRKYNPFEHAWSMQYLCSTSMDTQCHAMNKVFSWCAYQTPCAWLNCKFPFLIWIFKPVFSFSKLWKKKKTCWNGTLAFLLYTYKLIK